MMIELCFLMRYWGTFQGKSDGANYKECIEQDYQAIFENII